MSADTLPRVGTGSPITPDQDFTAARRALKRQLPRIVATNQRNPAEADEVGETNKTAVLRSRFGGREIVVPIRFDRRLVLGSTSELSGTDESGVVHVRLTADSPEGILRLSISATFTDSLLPSEILPFAQIVRCARHGETIDMSFADQLVVGSAMSLPEDDIDEFDAYVDLVERMDRFQRMTGSSFPMPERLSGKDLDELDTAERLLAGGDVEWSWAKATVTLAEDPRERLDSDPENSEMHVSIGGDYLVEIAGQTILIGQVRQTFSAGSIDVSPNGDESGGVDVELRPGQDSTAVARLTSRAHFDPYDRSDTERVELSIDALRAFDEGSSSLAAQVRG